MDRAELTRLLRATGCAEERGDIVFLRDPATARSLPEANVESLKSKTADGWLCVATGGTGGGPPKFARHDEGTLLTAVRGFSAHFDLPRVNAVDVLPAFHVSGLMARVRCAATGGEHVPWSWRKLEAGEFPEMPAGLAGAPWVISLVPTQLQRLLVSSAAVAWLRRFRIIFLGGGPTWPTLADQAARAELRVSLSYGMTETAAMVTALRPEEFLAGARNSGAPLPHAHLTVGDDGVVRVSGESVFRGYFPESSAAREFLTHDLGWIDPGGHLHITGRRDAVIITGGKKVQPDEVEAALRASGEFVDVAVLGVSDPQWGEKVVACYPADAKPPNLARAVASLAPHERPKQWVAVADWPRSAHGKVNRAALREHCQRACIRP